MKLNQKSFSWQGFKEFVGDNNKRVREYKKITQTNLYEYLNKSQATVSRYETGQSAMTLDTLYEISTFLDIPITNLISKKLDYYDCLKLEQTTQKSRISKNNSSLENLSLNLYYVSTSTPDKVIESPLITGECSGDSHYIPFLFEVKHNRPDKQLYDGKLVIDNQYAYFYIENRSRNEEGMIITYSYPQKNKPLPIGLLGVMISISHGYEQSPCIQKCVLSSKELTAEDILPFLKYTNNDYSTNSDYIHYLTKQEDKLFYEYISSL